MISKMQPHIDRLNLVICKNREILAGILLKDGRSQMFVTNAIQCKSCGFSSAAHWTDGWFCDICLEPVIGPTIRT